MIKPLKVHEKEHTTEKEIMVAINKRNGYVIKNQASSTTGKGRPDLSACIKGKYYGIEVKRPNSSLSTTPYQVKTLRSIAKAGGFACYSKTADMFNLRKYAVKTVKFKTVITNEEVKPLLRKKAVMVLQIIDDKTVKLYQQKG